MINKRGFSLIEALVALGIISFVLISILSGFTRQQQITANTTAKNMAVFLAESKLEEMLKFPDSTLTLSAGQTTDYIELARNFMKDPVSIDPQKANQFRRITTITSAGDFVAVEVRVDYPFAKSHNTYPFRVILRSNRWR